MLWARRLLTVCIALAFGSFSAFAAVPVIHSHELSQSASHAAEMSAQDMAVALDAHTAASDAAAPIAADKNSDNQSNQIQTGHVMHAHGGVSVAPAYATSTLNVSLQSTTISWSLPAYSDVSGGSLPLLRPPRPVI